MRGIALALPAGEDMRAGERALALWHALLAAERGRFALWLPVFMGAGDAFYFALRAEPPGAPPRNSPPHAPLPCPTCRPMPSR